MYFFDSGNRPADEVILYRFFSRVKLVFLFNWYISKRLYLRIGLGILIAKLTLLLETCFETVALRPLHKPNQSSNLIQIFKTTLCLSFALFLTN